MYKNIKKIMALGAICLAVGATSSCGVIKGVSKEKEVVKTDSSALHVVITDTETITEQKPDTAKLILSLVKEGEQPVDGLIVDVPDTTVESGNVAITVGIKKGKLHVVGNNKPIKEITNQHKVEIDKVEVKKEEKKISIKKNTFRINFLPIFLIIIVTFLIYFAYNRYLKRYLRDLI